MMNERAVLILAAVLMSSTSISSLGDDRVETPAYSTCKTWQEVVNREDLRYLPVVRVSTPGTKERPDYTGFWFFEGFQFDESDRYALAMKVHFQERDVTPSDRGEIGYFDLKDNNRWTKIGETGA